MGFNLKVKAVMAALDKRPYCPSCKLIWGRGSIGRVFYCAKCGKPLTIHSFKPWLRFLGGLCAIILGSLTLVVRQVPLIWIGGFLFGGSLVINGLYQWFKIIEIDAEDQKPKKQDVSRSDSKSMIFTCGKCSNKFSVKRGMGIITVTCPGCNEQRRVTT